MSKGRIALIAGAALLAAGIGFLAGYWPLGKNSQPDSAAVASQALLAASLKDLDGKPQPLSQWKGKVLIVNFWATWCPPCREEIPEFIKFQEKYRAKGVQFVGIAIDQKDKVQAFADEIGINYPTLLGELDAIELSRQAGNHMGGLPFTVILDRQGSVIATKVGGLDQSKLEKLIKPLL